MNKDFAVLLFFFGISLTVNVGLGVAWFRAIRRAGRLEQITLTARSGDDPRVERLESALDALAGQVDALASGQDFLNRVVSDRRAIAAAEADRTPH